MTDEPAGKPAGTAVRVALWRAMHVQADAGRPSARPVNQRSAGEVPGTWRTEANPASRARPLDRRGLPAGHHLKRGSTADRAVPPRDSWSRTTTPQRSSAASTASTTVSGPSTELVRLETPARGIGFHEATRSPAAVQEPPAHDRRAPRRDIEGSVRRP